MDTQVRTKQDKILKQSFFVFSGFPLNTQHSDDLSFVWQESGDDILIDSGKYGYNKDKYGII